MKKELAEVLKIYSLGSGDFCARIADGYSQPALIGLFADLLTLYFNDRNSSTLREFLTTPIAGYEHADAKIGHNGFKTLAAAKTI